MSATNVQPPEFIAGVTRRFDRSLSAAIDHAIVQAETAEAMGDTAVSRAWRKVLRYLEQTIPESGR